MDKYNHKLIEKKWQKRWQSEYIYRTSDDRSGCPKYYTLDMFPYPSGQGLHVGHPKGYIATDIVARFKRMCGYNVLHPMGWDAFGLPAENYAIKTKTHPKIAVQKNINRYKEQLSILGFDYDWSREINTTDPKYYRWTQWIFLQLFKHGLAYESREPINWCPTCKTGLAIEDLENGKCERCGSVVEKKPLRQWTLRITDYADKLLDGLQSLDWPKSIKELQRNWIGKSEGAEIEFEVASSQRSTYRGKIKIFTTRAETLCGATYLVLAPEHEIISNLRNQISNFEEVAQYIQESTQKTEIERLAKGKKKTGVELKGVSVVNPAIRKEIPVFIADYILASYGTGAVMAVPAHDERDFVFAKMFDLPIKRVIEPQTHTEQNAPYIGKGNMINSGDFNGLNSEDAREEITKKFGNKKVMYKLRDWVFSRQRYWGEPIPIIHCKKCGPVAVNDQDLPVKLPDVKHYEPTGTGESPFASIEEWVNIICPKCGGSGKRETNTMPQWAGSSWYYLRYIDPHNDRDLVDSKKERAWMPVDLYIGGAEHATRHLIYARFWHKFLYDIGAVSTSEPFNKLRHVGLILAEDNKKMSKRYNNVVNPDDIVHKFGADALRIYEMFMGPFDQVISWNTDNMLGSRRFLEKVWRMAITVRNNNNETHSNIKKELHQTIKKVSFDIENLQFNTAISQMMIFANSVQKEKYAIAQRDFLSFIQLLAPFAPHICEELWERFGQDFSVHTSLWPIFDKDIVEDADVEVAVQINGRVRDSIKLKADTTELEARRFAEQLPSIRYKLSEVEVRKFIYIPKHIINFVTT